MTATFMKIQAYLKEKEGQEIDSITLAKQIMIIAHRTQRRENGENYANHPYRCYQMYRHLLGLPEDENGTIDDSLLREWEIPFEGVEEVCLLHDVIEDSDLCLSELRDIFAACSLGTYFDAWIKEPLSRVTHDKETPYDAYIDLVNKNPTSALVKMLDLQDNLRVLDLVALNQRNFHRSSNYLNYIYLIEENYHFLERFQGYRSAMRVLV